MTPTINQSGANAGEDIIAGSKYVTNNYGVDKPSVLSILMIRLSEQVKARDSTNERLDSFALYETPYAVDGIIGLEAKLSKAERTDQYALALRKKELFVKLLTKFSLYGAAQEIFAHLLSKLENEWQCIVMPKIGILTREEIDEIVLKEIIYPIVHEVGIGVFSIDSNYGMGMAYWLAEQCYIRWHK